MSLRKLKIKLWNENPHCYWCGKLTILTNLPDGKLPPEAGTIDHIFSKFNPKRWLQNTRGKPRKVLACSKCNQERSIQETRCLSRYELLQRSKGFSLSPKGKPKIIKPEKSIKAAIDKLNKLDNFDECE